MSEPNYNSFLEYATLYADIVLDPLYEYLELKTVEKLVKEFVRPGALSLDYGCGPGNTTLFLKTLFLDAEGADINPHMLEVARERDPSGRYHIAEDGLVAKNDCHYDFVLSCWALVHSETKDDLQKYCKEIYRVLKDNGIFILVVHSDDYCGKEWLFTDTRLEQNINVSSGSVVATLFKNNNYVAYSYYWTEEDYTDALIKAGFTLIRTVKPLAPDDDGIAWIDEKVAANAAIYLAGKQ